MKTIQVRYFAMLRDQAGCGEETITTAADTPARFYDELRLRHGFVLKREQLRVAVDGNFAAWEQPLIDGAQVVFLPPVSGG